MSGACAGRKVFHQSRRIGEIKNPSSAGPPGDHQPEDVLQPFACISAGRPFADVALHMLAPVALDEPLDGKEEIGPHRLRAEIAAPDAAGDGVHQEQHDRSEDEQAGEVIDLLRPELDEEEIETPVWKIDQNRLRWRVRAAIPAHERKQVIDAERDNQNRPFNIAERAVDALRIDFAARRIERNIVFRRLATEFRFLHQTRKSRRPGRRLLKRHGGMRGHFSPPPSVCT